MKDNIEPLKEFQEKIMQLCRENPEIPFIVLRIKEDESLQMDFSSITADFRVLFRIFMQWRNWLMRGHAI